VKQLVHYCVPLFDGAGVIGCGDDEPEPVVLGGVTVRLVVVDVEEPLLAVLLLLFEPVLFEPAKTRTPTSSSTEARATQLPTPPLSSWRTTGSLKRRSSIKRGSVMASSLDRDAVRRLE
jgi:hypothetical protein